MPIDIFRPLKCKNKKSIFWFFRERGVGRVQWRRSFGASPMNAKDDAAALNGSGSAGQQNGANTENWLGNADYTFLMSCDLIESCRSLNGEMSWDNGDLEHLRMADVSARSNRSRNESVAVGCQTDAEVTIPGTKPFSNSVLVRFSLSTSAMCAEYSTADILLRDTHPDFGIKLTVPCPYPYTDLQLQLQLLRDWLDRMETKVPKLVLRPKWTRETLDRRIVDYKVSLAAARWPLFV